MIEFYGMCSSSNKLIPKCSALPAELHTVCNLIRILIPNISLLWMVGRGQSGAGAMSVSRHSHRCCLLRAECCRLTHLIQQSQMSKMLIIQKLLQRGRRAHSPSARHRSQASRSLPLAAPSAAAPVKAARSAGVTEQRPFRSDCLCPTKPVVVLQRFHFSQLFRKQFVYSRLADLKAVHSHDRLHQVSLPQKTIYLQLSFGYLTLCTDDCI